MLYIINIGKHILNYKIVKIGPNFFLGGGGRACGKKMVKKKWKSENA